jgi:molybdenum cofactor biosynthesis enzyme MoaA
MFDQKILCIGNNSEDTDAKVSQLAQQNQSTNHGLVCDTAVLPSIGYYHTSLADLIPAEVVDLSKKFDHVILLDQPLEQWSHPVLFSKTLHVIDILKESGCSVIVQNSAITENKSFFQNLLTNNKSFCIYPFIHLTSRGNGETQLCSRSLKTVARLDQIGDWRSNPHYTQIRNQMLEGQQLPDYCGYCYNIENNGGQGARIHETLEWTNKLKIKNLNDLQAISDPVYYEIRPSNKCNLQCRSCVPRDSHLIAREFKKIGITNLTSNRTINSYVGFDHVNIDTVERLYVAGGEPTIMPELYSFLRKCIKQGRTDFEFMINTNAVKISPTLMDLFSNFSRLGFSVSLDGVDRVNDYIRWPSRFSDIVANTHQLIAAGHHVAFISVVSIYNITSLDRLLEFQDQEFPGVPVMLQFDTFADDIQSPYNHPNAKLAMSALEKCKQTKAYLNYSRGTKSIVDRLYHHYSNNPITDLDKLKKFASFNKKLDVSRSHDLEDYIPELSKELLILETK